MRADIGYGLPRATPSDGGPRPIGRHPGSERSSGHLPPGWRDIDISPARGCFNGDAVVSTPTPQGYHLQCRADSTGMAGIPIAKHHGETIACLAVAEGRLDGR